MSSHYTDVDIEAAAKAILVDEIAKERAADEWEWADQSWLRDNARAVLKEVAGAIAARALREAARNPEARLSGHSGVSVRWLERAAYAAETGRVERDGSSR